MMTVLRAINLAGGFTDFANRKKVQMTRVDGRQADQGELRQRRGRPDARTWKSSPATTSTSRAALLMVQLKIRFRQNGGH